MHWSDAMSEEMQTDSGLIQSFGATLRYERSGDGPVLVLIHAGLADCRMYDDQVETLAQRCQVLRYDMHGFGRSSWPDQPYTHHGALRKLLDHLEIDHLALLGTSLGGSVAIDFTLAYPEMVDALIPVAAGINGYPRTAEDEELFAPVIEAFKANEYTKGIDLMIHIWVDGPQRSPDEVDPAVRNRVRSLYTDVLIRTREGGRQADQLSPPALPRLGEIHVPTMVVVGSGDIPSVQDQAEVLASAIPEARKEVLPRVAHMLNMEIPDEFNRLVLDFLRMHHLTR
jgi:3-oxoadipate enol-lactonase